MSQIASFYVLPLDRFDDLVLAATPRVVRVEKRRLVLFKTTVEEVECGLWDFLDGAAREAKPCDLWGAVFTDLDLVLEKRGLSLYGMARRDLSERLSSAMDSLNETRRKPSGWPGAPVRQEIPVFDHATAADALATLDDCGLTEDEVRAYAREDYPPEDEDPLTKTTLEAFQLAKRWLASVGRGEVGFLNVG